MHRRDLLDKLARFVPADARECAARDRIVRFVDAHPDCFERSLCSGHVTASAWILDEAATHVLLTHHRKLGKWLQLGGHADGDPDVLRVALREAREESGLSALYVASDAVFDVDVHEIPALGGEPAHLHYDVRFLLRASREATLTMSAESRDLAWIALPDVGLLHTDSSVLRMAEKVGAGPLRDAAAPT